MVIERDPKINWHDLGTLTSVTAWISSHEDGLAEWLKNARRAYQLDRANVAQKHRVAVFLFKDGSGDSSSRIGLLDMGGATLEDVESWSNWMDPTASYRDLPNDGERTQGNGGKAYMYKMFGGPARMLGVRDGRRNCKGFEGESGTEARGTPGFIPNRETGRNKIIENWKIDLNDTLAPYGLTFDDLPRKVRIALDSRCAFTLVEGEEAKEIYQGRIDVNDLIKKILRHNQTTFAIQQITIYVAHNGKLINNGKPLKFEPIEPYPGFEHPIEYPIPEQLPDDNDIPQSTTLNGTSPQGKLTLFTSKENMPNAYKKLKPRWNVTYRTEHQIIGSKPVSELIPTTPGKDFVYVTVELSALEPDYVSLGRTRPVDGPLVKALDRFVGEKLKELAKSISNLQRRELDEETLDEVHEENQLLNKWKNKYLPSGGFGIGGSGEGSGEGTITTSRPPPPPIEWGIETEAIHIDKANEILMAGKGATLFLPALLKPVSLDRFGKPVPGAELEWTSSDPNIAYFPDPAAGQLKAKNKGKCEIRVRMPKTTITSEPVILQVCIIKHVMLVPRNLEIPLGKRKHITTEVTTDEGKHLTDVLLNWKHDADDPILVSIHQTGWVIGNRIGKTMIKAGVDDSNRPQGVWSAIGTEVEVIPSSEPPEPGEGFPQLLLTDGDRDPNTGEIRLSDPQEPSLWQLPLDVQNNIWWLNLGSRDAELAFSMREDDPKVWRIFHTQKVAEMVAQVHMQEEYTKRGDDEQPDFWGQHKLALERFQIQYGRPMWEELNVYIKTGRGLE